MLCGQMKINKVKNDCAVHTMSCRIMSGVTTTSIPQYNPELASSEVVMLFSVSTCMMC